MDKCKRKNAKGGKMETVTYEASMQKETIKDKIRWKLQDISHKINTIVVENKDMHQYSLKKAVGFARDFFDSIGIAE